MIARRSTSSRSKRFNMPMNSCTDAPVRDAQSLDPDCNCIEQCLLPLYHESLSTCRSSQYAKALQSQPKDQK